MQSVWKYHRDKPDDGITSTESYKIKAKITGNTPADDNTKDVEIAVPLNYLCNFSRTLDMPYINCEINLILTWSTNCVISVATGAKTFKMLDAKHYVPLVTFLVPDNLNLLKQLKLRFVLVITCLFMKSGINLPINFFEILKSLD